MRNKHRVQRRNGFLDHFRANRFQRPARRRRVTLRDNRPLAALSFNMNHAHRIRKLRNIAVELHNAPLVRFLDFFHRHQHRQLALVDHRHIVGDAFDLVEQMRRKHDRAPLFRDGSHHHRENLPPRHRVQARRRFVEQQYRRPVALVRRANTPLRAAPYGSAPSRRGVNDGAGVEVQRASGPWLLVKRGAETGWLLASDVVRI